MNTPPVDITPPTTYHAVEGNVTGSQIVATFTDSNPAAAPADFSGTINWGDYSTVDTFSSSSVTLDSGTFSVHGSHIYAEPGSYHVTVVINCVYGQSATATNTTVAVADAALTDTTSVATYSVTAGKSTASKVLATFTDGNPAAPASDLTATRSPGAAR